MCTVLGPFGLHVHIRNGCNRQRLVQKGADQRLILGFDPAR
jgi:hypothetical protein